jgi:hypothetical protein
MRRKWGMLISVDYYCAKFMSDRHIPPGISKLEQLLVKFALLIPPSAIGVITGILIAIFMAFVGVAIRYLPSFLQSVLALNLILFLSIGTIVLLSLSWGCYVGISSAFLAQCQPRSIPSGKFSNALRILDKEAEKISALDFELIDRFYLKRNYEVIVYILKHRNNNIYWSLTHFVGRMTYSELFSEFENQIFLSTGSLGSSGNFPKPDNFYLQVFPNTLYDTFLGHHREAMEVFMSKGCYLPENLLPYARSEFTRIEYMINRHVTRYPFWAVQVVFWSLSNRGKKYRRSIQEQIDLRMITIPPSCS